MTRLPRGWLEPGRTDPELGLRAEVADPVWFLARQWQLGEFQGEDAASPVAVTVAPRHLPIRYDPDRPALDPTVVPAEALIEAEPGDWWTIGRRVRLGRAVAGRLDADLAARCRFGTLPTPYEALTDAVDGRAVFLTGALAGDPVFSEVPSPAPDRFSRRDLTHSCDFTAGEVELRVRDHRGGDVDWYSVDAGPVALPVPTPPTTPEPRELVPTRLTFPGAPHPRWWQIEDAAVDLGAFAPDRSHLATMLLSDLAVAHAEDWFVVPVPAPAGDDAPSAGVLVRLGPVTVRDSFGFEHDLVAPPADGPDAWSLFAVPGLDPTDLVVWPVAIGPSTGPLLDDIVLGVDEDANLAWAAELRADGREFLRGTESNAAAAETTRTGSRDFRYAPMTTVPEHWHPYRRTTGGWRQAVLADLTGPLPRPRPGPTSRLLGGPSGAGLGRGHELGPNALPSTGIRFRRRTLLARGTDGRPVLWVERSTAPAAGPPVSHLRWDVLVEEPTRSGGAP